MSKIEPLDIKDGYGADRLFAAIDAAGEFSIVSWTKHEMPWSILTRDEFAALVRWGARALALTDPSRLTPEAVAAERARLACDHRHTMGRGNLMVCCVCGEIVKPDSGEGEE